MAANGCKPGFPSPYEFQFTELDCYTHEPVQVKQDFSSLFSVLRDVLKHTTSIAEKCLLGKNEVNTPEMSKPVPTINCGLNVLKEIYCKVACEAQSKGDVADSIAKVLSTNSWAERAVLTLAAFALSYGELLVYVDRQQLNPLASLISSLRRVDEIIRVKEDKQFKRAIIGLNKLTNPIIQFTEFILELDSLSMKDSIHDMRTNIVTEITAAVERYSRFAIRFVAACMTVTSHLTHTKIKTARGLTSLASFISDELKTLQKTVENYKLEIAEWEQAYSKLDEAIHRGLGIVEVMTCMMSPISKLPVPVDQLKGNNVLLFISRIDDISQDDFSALVTVHNMLEKEHRDYKIVWIPVLEGGSGGLSAQALQKFEEWKRKMPWYVVSYEASKPIVGIKYIKERWQFRFRYNPMVVVLNTQGREECLDAMHMIRAWGPSAFPFNLRVTDPGMGPIILHITKKEIIKEEEYRFLYARKDRARNEVFAANLQKLVNDDKVLRAKLSITSSQIGDENSSMTIAEFLTRMEYMLCARMQWDMLDNITKEIQRLLFLNSKDENGWAMLCKGPKVLAFFSGTIIKDAVTKCSEWTKNMDKKDFEICLLEYTKRTNRIPCGHKPFQSLSGCLPVDLQCPDCGARMKRSLTYE